MTALRMGMDLVSVSRFRALYYDDDDALRDLFASVELADVGEGVDKWQRLAARFAVKEAVFKALEEATGAPSHSDIVVALRPSGAPRVELSGVPRREAESLGITAWLVSLAHTDDTAGATVIGLTAQR